MLRVLAAPSAAAAAAALLFLAWPYETLVAAEKAKLALSGVARVRRGPLLGYERDACAPGRACRCVALIHGLGDSALTWSPLLRHPAANGLRVLALDGPGREGSDAPASAEGYRIAAQAATLRRALESEPRCERWTVAGNSLGGWISLRLALDWPAGVERVVSLNGVGIDDKTGALESAAATLKAGDPEGLKEFMRKARFKPLLMPDRGWRSAAAAVRRRSTAAIVSALGRDDLLDRRLPALKTPVTVVWGEADGVIPLEYGRRLAKSIPGAGLVVIPRCGHLPQQECPERVAAELFRAP